MDSTTVRHVLIVDWAEVENTPLPHRRPAIEQRWHLRAQRLADEEGRPAPEVTAELISQAQSLAARNREHQLTELARDLAVSRALGIAVKPPWRRRLAQLVQVMDLPHQAVASQVERKAASVRVVVQS